MTGDTEDGQVYLNNVPICYFEDNLATDGTFMGTQFDCETSEIGIIAKKDDDGELTGLKQVDGQELSDVLTKSWH